MDLGLKRRIAYWLDLDEKELYKIFLLAFAFFCVIGAYTVLKEMKDALFVRLVGAGYLSTVKLVSMFLLVPATMLYARLVDSMSRFRLLAFYSMLYGIVGVLIAFAIGQPAYGLGTIVSDPSNPLGWFIYLFYEGAVPFVVSVFWSFASSVTAPETAKKGYPLIITGSKLGGMTTAFIAWSMFSPTGIISGLGWSDVFVHQILLSVASMMLCSAPYIIYYLLITGDKRDLHGYEASYQADVQQEKKKKKTGMFAGLFMMMKYPYVFGIFGMIFFYELVNVVLGIQRLVILQGAAKSLGGFTGSMFEQRFYMHLLGFVISFFGTRMIVKRLGERISLLLIPLITGVLLLYFMVAYNPDAVLVVFMVLGTMNYAFSSPLREALYIPTVRDVRFKSKSWIESFGTKFSKGCGATFIGVVQRFVVPGTTLFFATYSIFFAGIVVLWTVLALWLGKRHRYAVENNEAIGQEESASE